MYSFKSVKSLAYLVALAKSQAAGSQEQNDLLPLTYQTCSASGCTEVNGNVVLDSQWRWLHQKGGYENCFTGTEWSSKFCPDGATCTQNCVVEGVSAQKYTDTYGITTMGNKATIRLVTKGQYGDNVGARMYLMDTPNSYAMFKLKNKEFTFTTDVSQLECGMNGAVYFTAMDADGGAAKFGNAGAAFGTGYCDAQCPRDLKFIDGQANVEGWDPAQSIGNKGACCTEFDVWEANKNAQAYTTHVCQQDGYFSCVEPDCGTADRFAAACDKNGCDFHSGRHEQTNFFAPGGTVDSTQPVTIVTQFITADGTDTGPLTEIRRKWIQGGKVIDNVVSAVQGLEQYSSISDEFCVKQANVFQATNDEHTRMGGLKVMGDAFEKGMVLVLSLWTDHASQMHWLDSVDPYPATKPGDKRGPCPVSGGDSKTVESTYPNATGIFSDFRSGDIDTTYSAL